MFQEIYSPSNPPPGAASQTAGASLHFRSKKRLEFPQYRRRLVSLHADRSITLTEILRTLRTEFPTFSLSIQRLKRDMTALGLRRYKRWTTGSSSSPDVSEPQAPADQGEAIEYPIDFPIPPIPFNINIESTETQRNPMVTPEALAEANTDYASVFDKSVPNSPFHDALQDSGYDCLEGLFPELSYLSPVSSIEAGPIVLESKTANRESNPDLRSQ